MYVTFKTFVIVMCFKYSIWYKQRHISNKFCLILKLCRIHIIKTQVSYYIISKMELKPTCQPSHGPHWFLWPSCARLQRGTFPLLLLVHWYSWPNPLVFLLASLCLWGLQIPKNPEIVQYKSLHYLLVATIVTVEILKIRKSFFN